MSLPLNIRNRGSTEAADNAMEQEVPDSNLPPIKLFLEREKVCTAENISSLSANTNPVGLREEQEKKENDNNLEML